MTNFIFTFKLRILILCILLWHILGYFNEKSYNNEYLHYSKFNYLNIHKKEYTGDIIKDINKAKNILICIRQKY
mgnify:CR=1 FL=1